MRNVVVGDPSRTSVSRKVNIIFPINHHKGRVSVWVGFIGMRPIIIAVFCKVFGRKSGFERL